MAIVNIQDFFKNEEDTRNVVFFFKTKIKNDAGTYEDMKVAFPIQTTIKEAHSLRATITKNEIQDGTFLSEHIHLQPQTVTLDCMISENPVFFLSTAIQNIINFGVNNINPLSGAVRQLRQTTLLNNALGNVLGSFDKYARDLAFSQLSYRVLGDDPGGRGYKNQNTQAFVWQNILKANWQAKQPFEVVSNLEVLKNVFFQSISFDKDHKIGNSIRFKCVLEELRIVSAEVTVTKKNKDNKNQQKGNATVKAIDPTTFESQKVIKNGRVVSDIKETNPNLPAGSITQIEDKVRTTLTDSKNKASFFFNDFFTRVRNVF